MKKVHIGRQFEINQKRAIGNRFNLFIFSIASLPLPISVIIAHNQFRLYSFRKFVKWIMANLISRFYGLPMELLTHID